MKRIVALTLLATLAACGGRKDLEPLPGQPPIATPIGASRPPTAPDLTTPSTQARPQRSVDLLYQSQERPADPFDLPPEGAPMPQKPEAKKQP